MTKVYNGIRFVASDVPTVFEQIQALRPVINDLVLDIERRWVANVCTLRIDAAFIDGKPEELDAKYPNSVLVKVNEDLWERQQKTRGQYATRDPAIDPEFTVCAMPFEDRLYGMVFTEQPRMREAFEATGMAEEFAYWNSVDRPEETSAEAWAERERIWSAILARHPLSIPSACGLTFEFPPPANIVHADEVLERVRPVEERARRHAQDKVLGRRVMETSKGETRGAMTKIAEARRWLETEEGAAAITVEIERISKLLPEITRKLLVGP